MDEPTPKALYMRQWRAGKADADRAMPTLMHRLLRDVGAIAPTTRRVCLRSPVRIPPPCERPPHPPVTWEPALPEPLQQVRDDPGQQAAREQVHAGVSDPHHRTEEQDSAQDEQD